MAVSEKVLRCSMGDFRAAGNNTAIGGIVTCDPAAIPPSTRPEARPARAHPTNIAQFVLLLISIASFPEAGSLSHGLDTASLYQNIARPIGSSLRLRRFDAVASLCNDLVTT
jgi:hypothetical protein